MGRATVHVTADLFFDVEIPENYDLGSIKQKAFEELSDLCPDQVMEFRRGGVGGLSMRLYPFEDRDWSAERVNVETVDFDDGRGWESGIPESEFPTLEEEDA